MKLEAILHIDLDLEKELLPNNWADIISDVICEEFPLVLIDEDDSVVFLDSLKVKSIRELDNAE